jgi:hypothetical protein
MDLTLCHLGNDDQKNLRMFSIESTFFQIFLTHDCLNLWIWRAEQMLKMLQVMQVPALHPGATKSAQVDSWGINELWSTTQALLFLSKCVVPCTIAHIVKIHVSCDPIKTMPESFWIPDQGSSVNILQRTKIFQDVYRVCCWKNTNLSLK